MKFHSLPPKYAPLLIALLLANGCGHAAGEPADKAWAAISTEYQCTLDSRLGEECVKEESIRILDDRARAPFGTRTIAFRKTGKVEVSDVYTITPDGRRIELKNDEMQTGDAPSDNAGFVAVRFIKFAFKEVVVGSTLHLRLKSASPVISPFGNVSTALSQQPSWARIDKVRGVYTANLPLRWKGADLEKYRITQSDDRKRIEIESLEPFLTPPVEDGAGFVLRNFPRIEISSTDSWPQYLNPIAAAFAERLREPLPENLQKAMAGLQGKPEAERVRAVLDLIRKRFRYMGDWRESEHGYVPFPLAEIEQRGYGDCKDFALTTAALLRSVGIPAQVAIIHAGVDDRRPLLPTLGYLNHAIVRAVVGGKPTWLDPTQTVNTLYSAPLPIEQNRIAFVLGDDGKIAEDWIPTKDTARNNMTQEIDLTPAEDGQWQLNARVVTNGLPAAQNAAGEARDGKQDDRDIRGMVASQINILEKKVTGRGENSALVDRQDLEYSARISRFTKPIGGYQLFEGAPLGGTLVALRRHMATHGHGDLPINGGLLTRTVRIHNKTTTEPLVACRAMSPWIDLSLTPVPVPDGVGWQVIIDRKRPWILATEMQDAEAIAAIDQQEACTNRLKLLLK